MEKVYVTAAISADKHESLRKTAADRGLHLQKLNAAILEWAGEQDVKTLVRLGVRLPIYADEFAKGDVPKKTKRNT